jgi:uncharacterized LabA/DUF88 family protein
MLKIGVLIDGENTKYWRIDYVKLLQYLISKYRKFQPDIIIKNIYISVKKNEIGSEQRDFWHFLKMNGFVLIKREYHEGQSVDVDAKVGSELRKYSAYCDILVLVAGDGDYLPVLEDLSQEIGQKSLIISKFTDTSGEFKKIKDIDFSNIEVEYLEDLKINKEEI